MPLFPPPAAPLTWIFGYGSLVWRPAFPFVTRHPGWISGWTRRLWQRSTDHRGTVDAPGRVATLVEAPGERCWGMAYAVCDDDLAAVLAALDVREQQGYERLELDVHLDESAASPRPGEVVRALMYLATADNPYFTGGEPDDAIAAVVRHAVGPSGANVEYVLHLAAALREHGVHDPHIDAVAALLAAPDA